MHRVIHQYKVTHRHQAIHQYKVTHRHQAIHQYKVINKRLFIHHQVMLQDPHPLPLLLFQCLQLVPCDRL